MDRQIKKLGIALGLCFLALFAQVNYVQFWQADRINDEPINQRQEQRSFNSPRGDILSADGVVLATSEENRGGFAFRRLYPEGALFGGVTGYYSFNLGSTGVEATYEDDLSGPQPRDLVEPAVRRLRRRENFGTVS